MWAQECEKQQQIPLFRLFFVIISENAGARM
jgi:hypothetical protein